MLVGDNSGKSFKVQDCIIVEDEEGREIARAIVNYSVEDLAQENVRTSGAEEEFRYIRATCASAFRGV